MLGYVTIGTNDLDRAIAFYDRFMPVLGAERVLTRGRGAHYGKPGKFGTVMVTRPFDGQPATVGNGTMVALAVRDKAKVEQAHAAALEFGAQNEGEPGIRSHNFYGAYFRDPDGNKICIFTMVGPVEEEA